MGFFSSTLVESTPEYNCYFVTPNFTPRRSAASGDSFDAKIAAANAGTREVTGGAENALAEMDALSEAQRNDLVKRLHSGQGDLSPREWDDFLADLEDLGLLSHNERMFANGTLVAVPDAVLNGNHVTYDHNMMHTLDSWSGDPLQWLENLDFYLYKQGWHAQMDGKSTSGISAQRNAWSKVAQIVNQLVGNGSVFA